MDYHKVMQERQQAFLANPRKGIEEFIKHNDSSGVGFTQLGLVKRHPEFLLLFKEVHSEYGELLGSVFSRLGGKELLDESELIGTAQRIQEAITNYIDCCREENEVNSLRLARSFSAYQELIWKKLKKVVFVAGLNPDKRYLKIPILKQKLERLETDHELDLSILKSILVSNLRNSVGHEETVFVAPKHVSFRTTEGVESEEVDKLSLDEIKYRIAKFTTIIGAMHVIEQTVISSKLEPLLKLPDEKLAEYMRTGVLTKEMDKIIASST